MSSYRERLDFLLLQQRVSLLLRLVPVVICGLLVAGGLFLLYMPAEVAELTGTVLAHGPQSSEEASDRFFVVRLDSGLTVRARVYPYADYKPGRRVILTETTTQLFGYKRYQLNGYVEEPRNTERFP